MAVRTNNPELVGTAEKLDTRQKSKSEAKKNAEIAYREETERVCDIVSHAQKFRQNPEYYALDTMAELTVRVPAQTVVKAVEKRSNAAEMQQAVLMLFGMFVGAITTALFFIVL